MNTAEYLQSQPVRGHIWGAVGLIAAVGHGSLLQAGSFVDDFSDDPLLTWQLADGPGDGFGDNENAQFEYHEDDQELIVYYDSSLPTVRLQHDLGGVWTQEDAFAFTATLRFDSIEAPANDFMQISFALTNSQTTGAQRTGTFPVIDSNTFDNLELAYYPNISEFFGGPFATVTVQGSADGSSSAFDHLSFASVETELSLGETLTVSGHYNPLTTKLTYRIDELVELSVDITELPPFGSPAGQFAVDRFSISSYFDGEDFTPETISLLATVAYESVEFTALGDGDHDGDVDLVDFGRFQRCFTGDERMATDECAFYDFDGDGDVDIDDYSVFQFVGTGPQS